METSLVSLLISVGVLLWFIVTLLLDRSQLRVFETTSRKCSIQHYQEYTRMYTYQKNVSKNAAELVATLAYMRVSDGATLHLIMRRVPGNSLGLDKRLLANMCRRRRKLRRLHQ